MRKKMIFLAFCVSLTSALVGCKDDEFTLTVRNLAEVGISELYVVPETDKSVLENRLCETLPTDTNITISLGELTEEDMQDGVSIEAYNAVDGSSASFSMLQVEKGDTITLYMDDFGLAVGVNMTDEEISAQRDRDNADAAAAQEAVVATATTEAITATVETQREKD